MRPIHLVGLLLWRGGLLLIGVFALIYAVGWVLRFVELPLQIEIGIGLAIAGFALVMLSLILERYRDYRAEKGLGQ